MHSDYLVIDSEMSSPWLIEMCASAVLTPFIHLTGLHHNCQGLQFIVHMFPVASLQGLQK